MEGILRHGRKERPGRKERKHPFSLKRRDELWLCFNTRTTEDLIIMYVTWRGHTMTPPAIYAPMVELETRNTGVSRFA